MNQLDLLRSQDIIGIYQCIIYTNKVLSKNNTVVTMAGDIGDEIFGGYNKYLKMYNLNKNQKTGMILFGCG